MSEEMKNKICLVTGATGGIGKATALALAARGATVVLHGRNRDKGTETVREISAAHPDAPHALLLADLASFREIRELAKQFQERFDRLDVLINNAAIFATRREYSADQVELQFAVNHLAPFLLTNLLLDALRASPAGRIINISSVSHRFGRINLEDLNRTKNYEGLRVYEQSKLANLLFTYELARRLKHTNITVNAMNPGRVRTGIGNKKASGIYRWLWILNKPFLLPPRKGAETAVYLASSPEVEKITGAYFYKCRPHRSSGLSYNEDLAKKLWERSEEMTSGIKNYNRTGMEMPAW